MNVKARLFYAAWLAAGLLCIVIIGVTRYPAAAAKLLRKDYNDYGELYNMCKVSAFKYRLDQRLGYNNKLKINSSPADKSEVIFAGDSFFGGFMGCYFEKCTRVPTYDLRFRAIKSTPLSALDDIGFKANPKTRFLVYERAERNLASGVYPAFRERGKKRKLDKLIKSYMVDTTALEHVVTENEIVDGIIESRNTFRFLTLGEISPLTPVYSLAPPCSITTWN